LFIDNDDDAANAYQLEAGSVFDATADTVTGLPSGWTVEFFLVDNNGAATGSAITTTPVIAGNTLDYPIVAVVTVPADQAQAVGDFSIDNDADGVVDTLDGNSDGDGDYPLFFRVISANTGASDVTLQAIDVESVVSASFSPNGSQQISLGGRVVYVNTLANNGNAPDVFTLTYSNSQPGWSSNFAVDTDGDGVVDTQLGDLTAGTISVLQPDGSVASIEVTINASGDPEVNLEANETFPIESTVFAPTTAITGEIDVLTISAESSASGVIVSVQNQSQIVNGKISMCNLAHHSSEPRN